MELRRIKSLFPAGAGNFDAFCRNVSARGLKILNNEEIKTALHQFSYFDENDEEQKAIRQVDVVLYDRVNEVYYDAELNPYKVEIGGAIQDLDRLMVWPIHYVQRRRLSSRRYLDEELATIETAKKWFALCEGTDKYLFIKGGQAKRGTILTISEENGEPCFEYSVLHPSGMVRVSGISPLTQFGGDDSLLNSIKN